MHLVKKDREYVAGDYGLNYGAEDVSDLIEKAGAEAYVKESENHTEIETTREALKKTTEYITRLIWQGRECEITLTGRECLKEINESLKKALETKTETEKEIIMEWF